MEPEEEEEDYDDDEPVNNCDNDILHQRLLSPDL